MRTTLEIMSAARDAKRSVMTASTETKNALLMKMAEKLRAHSEDILASNAEDVRDAAGRISSVMLDRLSLTAKRIDGMAKGIEDVAALPDPAWRKLEERTRPNGLIIEKTSVPLGVIAIIYESRPNVTSDAAALCIKSGNAVILRGGRDAYRSSFAIVSALREACAECALPEDLICIAEDTSRQSSIDLMHGTGYIDLLIPRGGAGLIRACVEEAKVPCIETGTGICHIYADRSADIDMAIKIIENAKTSRPSVCNAAEVLLVHKDIAPSLLPLVYDTLVTKRKESGLVPVELRLDGRAAEIIPGSAARENDYDTEFLDYILAVKVVDSLDEAIAHIQAHSTRHSEAIITSENAVAEKFFIEIDSAAVYHNASTRFTDGGEFGMGCEMGISTGRLHARGPMGLSELCTYKYIIRGNGNIR